MSAIIRPTAAETYMYGRPGTKAVRLRQWLHENILAKRAAGQIPTNGRFLYYEALHAIPDLVSKDKPPRTDGKVGRRSDQDLIDQLTELRKMGLVDWEEIGDRGRHALDYTGYPSILEGTRRLVDAIGLDPWRGRTRRGTAPLLLVESESLAGVLDAVAREYRIVLLAVRGQSAGFLMNVVLPFVKRGHHRVLTLFDFDKAGGDIEENARTKLEAAAGITLDWTRLALTEAQITEYDIDLIPRYDKRDKQTRMVAECEALTQTTLVEIVRVALGALLPEALDHVHERERRDRRAVLRRLQ